MSGEMEELRTLVASTQADMRKLLDFSRRAGKQAYDRAVADLTAQQREAVAAGDTAKYDQIETQLDEMEEARGEPEAPEPVREPAPKPEPKLKIAPEYQDFMDENEWFNIDPDLNAEMISAHNAVIRKSPGMALAYQLEKAKEAVMARFPKKFGLEEAPPPPPKRRPAAPLPPSGQRPGARADATGINSIADPQERAEVRRGYASAKKSMPTLTEGEYLDIWNNPHADVLDVIKAHKPTRK